MQVTFKGLNLGDDSGCYYITSLDGWEGRPDVSNASVSRPRRPGSFLGGLNAEKRVITMEIDIAGGSDDGYQTAGPKSRLRAVMGVDPNESPLTIDLGSGSEIANVRVTAFHLPTTDNYMNKAHAVIEFTAIDPRRYSPAPYKVSTGLYTPTPGAVYPLTYPFQYSAKAPTSTGSVLVRNDGNADSPIEFTFVGPVTNPSITISAPGYTRRSYFNLTLAAGEPLYVNADTGEVSINGVDRYGTAMGALVEEMNLPPGISTVTFGGSGTSDARLDMSWRFANM